MSSFKLKLKDGIINDVYGEIYTDITDDYINEKEYLIRHTILSGIYDDNTSFKIIIDSEEDINMGGDFVLFSFMELVAENKVNKDITVEDFYKEFRKKLRRNASANSIYKRKIKISFKKKGKNENTNNRFKRF